MTRVEIQAFINGISSLIGKGREFYLMPLSQITF
nr:MAG TPA: Testis-expressed sequence 13 protein family [Caudoviricetes sp.]